jgi:hypothetical protein
MNAPATQTVSNSSPITAAASTAHPPRAPLVLRVGVTGHRPDPQKRSAPNVAALCEICRELLLRIQDTFAGVATIHHDLFDQAQLRQDGKPQGLRLISALAEGADQWVASEAVQLGYELQAVLPFERTEYEKDFTDPGVKDEHCQLREKATAVFELDGDRKHAGESYLAAGRVLLNQSDLLIALWDRQEAQGVGGTGQIVREALQRGIPTLWVNWNAPTDWQLLQPAWRLLEHSSDDQDNLKQLEKKVTELLLPTIIKHNGEKTAERDLRRDYFADRRRSRTLLGGWWNFFRDWLRGRPRRLTVRVPEFIPTTEEDWQEDWAGRPDKKRQHKLSDSIIKWIKESYLSHYAWANQLSIYYANHYRSSFVWLYLLGAFAVLLALIGKTAAVSHLWELVFIMTEVVVICLIIGLTWYGRRRRWHERWIDYRTLAERLRLVRFNCLLGGVWQQASVPSHLATYGNPTAAWMHWHARAIERAAGLPNVVVNAEYLTACKELLLEALITDQEKYHQDNAARLRSVDHKLHRLGEGLFLATLAACASHFMVALYRDWFGQTFPVWDRWLMFGAAFLPALGAVMAAIRSQGEFHRVVERSRAMQEELAQLSQAVANVPVRPSELNSQLLQQAVEQTTRLMYNEVLDWRIVFQDRPLVWPA